MNRLLIQLQKSLSRKSRFKDFATNIDEFTFSSTFDIFLKYISGHRMTVARKQRSLMWMVLTRQECFS